MNLTDKRYPDRKQVLADLGFNNGDIKLNYYFDKDRNKSKQIAKFKKIFSKTFGGN